MHWIRICLLGLASLVQAQSFETTVTPLPNEILPGLVTMTLLCLQGRHLVRAVWVTFDRGRDIMKFYDDADVLASPAFIISHS